MKALVLDDSRTGLSEIIDFVFQPTQYSSLDMGRDALDVCQKSHMQFLKLLESSEGGGVRPIYGVTTGFGDSCTRALQPHQAEELQNNLIQYLTCGTGRFLSYETSRAIMVIRLRSLLRGFSGVSRGLLDRFQLFINRDWIPVIPSEGSLGASGDLIPLSYIARAFQGEGYIWQGEAQVRASEILNNFNLKPYKFGPKEALAVVNGTSAMAGALLVQLESLRGLYHLSEICSAWMVLAIGGHREAFDTLVNERASGHVGQWRVAQNIRTLLQEQNYQNFQSALIVDSAVSKPIQDRYSVRCAPQILGPVFDTLEIVGKWLENEINSTSDNPLISAEGEMALGGNFYGGYLSQGLDYLKISAAHMADLMDRQLTLLIDEKSNRGLPPNLAAWNLIPEEERHLHHGLKGLHQCASAITSEIMAKAIPNGIFSRSSESHNQDKVSLGMSAANQCDEITTKLWTLATIHLISLAQALDLRNISLQDGISQSLYQTIRSKVELIQRDRALDTTIIELRADLVQQFTGQSTGQIAGKFNEPFNGAGFK